MEESHPFQRWTQRAVSGRSIDGQFESETVRNGRGRQNDEVHIVLFSLQQNHIPLFDYRRSLRQSMTESNKHLKRQLDSFEDHRPYFTYWTCTVQVLIMFIALITYGLGPVGVNLHRRSGSVLFQVLTIKLLLFKLFVLCRYL